MKKTVFLYSFLVIMLIFTLVSCESVPDGTAAGSSAGSTSSVCSSNPEYLNKKYAKYETDAAVTWEVEYPVFTDPALSKLNGACLNYTVSKADTFFEEASIIGMNRDEEYMDHFLYSQEYTVSSYGDFVNVVFTVYEFTGGAHGNYYFKTFNWDSSTSSFCDVFSATDLSPKDLSLKCREKLVEQLDKNRGKDDPLYSMYYKWIQTGTEPSALKNLNFKFYEERQFFGSERGVEVIFEPYSVAPYSMGMQTVRLPLE